MEEAIRTKTTYFDYCKSAIGNLCIGASDNGLMYIKVVNDVPYSVCPNQYTSLALQQLEEYFIGERKEFDVKLDLIGYSDFAMKVWQKLICIPYGKTITYQQLAIQMGDVKCIRAAASANGRNPIPIIIPCHRVIGSDGSLTGFALGLDIKRQLLAIENPSTFNSKQLSLNFLN